MTPDIPINILPIAWAIGELRAQIEDLQQQNESLKAENEFLRDSIPLSPAEFHQHFGHIAQNDYWHYLNTWYEKRFDRKPSPQSQKLSFQKLFSQKP